MTSKAEYLKRYLSESDTTEKKKKKRDKSSKYNGSGIKILEDDAFLSVSRGVERRQLDSDEEQEVAILHEQIKKKVRGPKFKAAFAPVDDGIKKEEPDWETEENAVPPSTSSEKPKDSPRSSRSGKEQTSRRQRHDSDSPPPRQRHDCDSDEDVPRRRRHDSASPPRSRRRHDSDNSPVRNRRNDSEDRRSSPRIRHDSDNEPPRKTRKRHDSDSSPPRRVNASPDSSRQRKRHRHDSDESPPRKRAGSPARRRAKSPDLSPPRRPKGSSPNRRNRSRSSSPNGKSKVSAPEIIGRAKTTLDGKTAGLQSAGALKEESLRRKEREDRMFEEMDAARTGRDAETVVREKQVRKGKPEDKEKKEREAKKQAELEEKYRSWNKGVRQLQERNDKLAEMARVVEEPLARPADDEAMNEHLKNLLHEADPMAAIISRNRREEAIDRGDLVYPKYNGPFIPNRFGIRPGYRWDGVDRSNGFEAKLSVTQNKKMANEGEYYQNLAVYE